MARPSIAIWTVAALCTILIAALVVWFNRPGTDPEAPRGAAPAPPTATAAAAATPRSAATTPETERTPAVGATTAPESGRDEPSTPDATRHRVATVRGRVVDAHAAPIQGARVAVVVRETAPAVIAMAPEMLETRGEPATTDAKGAFELPLRALGPFELVAAHDDRPDARATGQATANGVDEVLLVMRDGASISGRVVDIPEGTAGVRVAVRRVATGLGALPNPVGSALLDLGSLLDDFDVPDGARRSEVAADGSFTMRGLDPDVVYQLFGLRGDSDGAIPVRCTERVEVRPGVSGVELRWRKTFAITAKVLDDETGAPIEDLDVAVGPVRQMRVLGMSVPVPMRQPVAQKRFPNGTVRVDGIGIADAGSQRVSMQVGSTGRRPWARDDIDPPTHGQVDLGTIRLRSAPIVKVVVTDAAGAVSGAKVRVVPAPDAEGEGRREVSFSTTVSAGERPSARSADPGDDLAATTDAAGVALVTTEPGRAQVVVESAAHARWQGPVVDVPERGTIEQAAQLLRGGAVRVSVRDGHGTTLVGKSVRRRDEGSSDVATLEADATGTAVFERLSPGPHWFSVAGPASRSRIRVGVSLGAANSRANEVRVDVLDGSEVAIELTTPLTGSLRGVVTLDGEALDRAEVRVSEIPRNAVEARSAEVDAAVESMLGAFGGPSAPTSRTDGDGAFEIAGVPVGPRRLVVTHKDLAMPGSVDIVVAEGENVHDIALRATTVRGRVLRKDGAPIEGASVSAALDEPSTTAAAELAEAASMVGELFGGPGRREVRTDEQGRFVLRGVRSGIPLRIEASARMHVAAFATTPPIADGESRDGLELRLVPGGRIRAKATGDAVAAVIAEWAGTSSLPEGIAAKRTALLRNGRATFDGMPAGPWRVRLDPGGSTGGDPPGRVVTVTEGTTVDTEL